MLFDDTSRPVNSGVSPLNCEVLQKGMNNYRKYLFLIIFCVSCLSAYPPKVTAQIEGQEREEKLSERSLSASEERETRIKEELAQSKDNEWAGEYHYGDELGVNVNLMIAPKSGFVFSWFGCMGLYDLNYGNVGWSDRKIKLLFEHPNKREGFQGIAPELIPVLWGERHYLIPSNEILEFTNAVNASFEPCTMFCSRFLLKRGDEKKKVSGQPDIPDEYRAYLLEKSIKSDVLSLGESRIVTDKDDPESQFRVTKVLLKAGSAKGVLVGMEFHVYSPSRIAESAKVTKVEEQFSEAEIVQVGLDGAFPSTRWKFSTSIKDVK
jgi:hypothetical protein